MFVIRVPLSFIFDEHLTFSDQTGAYLLLNSNEFTHLYNYICSSNTQEKPM